MSMNTINFDDLGLAKSDRILDVGCGEGRHTITAWMLEEVDAVGVDLNIEDVMTRRDRF
ncbi:MAG: class I SAM-dependent methyltransferase, partial [Pseudomonadales bacterium]|nr:class I SAM-dependent methyltransferase [Pseudomonadales bacterium]